MFNKNLKLAVLFVFLSLLLSACSLPFQKNKVAETDQELDIEEVAAEKAVIAEKTGKMKKFADLLELESFIQSNSNSLSVDVSEKKNPVVSLSYFTDESLKNPDLLNYENNFTFALVKDKVKVIRLTENENIVLSEISFDSRPSGLILADKSLIVYGQDQSLTKSENSPFYFIKIYNLDQPAEPKLVNNYSFEGQIKDLFVKDSYFYLITETDLKQELSQKKLARVYRDGMLLSNSCDGVEACFSPELFYFDLDYNQVKFLNINVINLNDSFSSVKGSVYLMNEDHKSYVSGSSVFISYFKKFKKEELNFEAKRSLVYDRLSDVEKSKINEVELLGDFVLNKLEKQKRVELILDSFITSLTAEEKKSLELEISVFVGKSKAKLAISDESKVHRLRLQAGNIDYYAVGVVKGDIFNNYSVLEKDDFVYLGTNSGDRLNSSNELKYYANVYILDTSMKVLGKLENLASKESLYGVRFLGNRAFLVSSEEEGSLFVVSLSDNTKPEFAGTVKLPGSSVQLFPVDKNANKLISLSYYSEVENEKNRIKLSLIDISNLKEPKETDSYLLGEFAARSLVFSDRKSFYYSAKSNLIMVPVALEKENKLYFSGVFVFKVLGDKLEMKGQIDHSAAGYYNYPDNFSGFSYFDNSAKRSFVVGDLAYSYSNKFFASANLNNLEKPESVLKLSLMNHSDDAQVSELNKDKNTEAILEDYYLDGVPVMEDYERNNDYGPNDQVDNYPPATDAPLMDGLEADIRFVTE